MTDSAAVDQQPNSDDLLLQQLKTIPAFRALLRSVEARFYRAVDLPQPILDVGCGDGHFAGVTLSEPITAGIDPWWGPLKKAQASKMYDLPLQAQGDFLPFPNHTFASAFSNSVLEHIPDIQPVLDEVSRVMKPGAPFVITVPSHNFSEFLGGASFFERLGLESVADSYRAAFNRISRHAHTDPPEIWADRLALAGFTIERWQYYFSKEALRALEIGHAQGLPSAVLHALTGHWILGPWESNLKPAENWVRPYYEEAFPQQGAYLFFLARKTADEPLQAELPPAEPYDLAELERLQTAGAGANGQAVAPPVPAVEEMAAAGALQTEEGTDTAASEQAAQGTRLLIPGLLVALTLLFAFLGQAALRATPEAPGGGLRWFLFSALSLLLLLWFERPDRQSKTRSWQWPQLAAISKQRWLLLPALLLSFFAYRVASPGDGSPAISLGLWAAAVALAAYALSNETPAEEERPSAQRRETRLFTLKTGVLLFLLALLVRLFNLGGLPFILNGTEASIGLEALNVLEGVLTNPFSSGWLTNPTLPFFLQAIPLRLFGVSTESLRLLSALIGALTVPVLYVIGQALYGRGVGLAAAILLAGSHFHVHFSRSGLSNAWDALLTLLALGAIAIAWQQDSARSRPLWLLAGTAVGLSAYLYTASHLLPIMLLVLSLLLIVVDRAMLKKQWRGAAAMAGLALVIALPQMLHYQASPGLFMERANTVGILNSQSGWLADEAARSGLSQLQIIGTQFRQAALAFNATIETSTSYGPLVPLVNFLFGLLFVLGLIIALVRVRQIRYSILLVWIAVTVIFAGALLLSPPISHRLVIAMPAVALLAAAALNELVRAVNKEESAQAAVSERKRPLAYFLILVLCAGVIAIVDLGFYFRTYPEQHRFGDRNTEIADGIANYLNTLDGEWVAHFYGPPAMYSGFPTIPFLAGDFEQGLNLFDVPEAGTPEPGYETGRQTFLFLPERYNEVEQIRALYPFGKEQRFSGYYADPLFYVYEVEANP